MCQNRVLVTCVSTESIAFIFGGQESLEDEGTALFRTVRSAKPVTFVICQKTLTFISQGD